MTRCYASLFSSLSECNTRKGGHTTGRILAFGVVCDGCAAAVYREAPVKGSLRLVDAGAAGGAFAGARYLEAPSNYSMNTGYRA